MITLCMDTSSKFLVMGLIRDDKVVSKVQENCWKKQSEELFPRWMHMMEENHLEPEDIDSVVITEGPGSYTGVRIAMTVAKVFCSMRDLPLYTVGTLQLFAGTEACRVVLDARGGRAYTAVLKDGNYTEEPSVCAVDEIPTDGKIIGDVELVEKENLYPDLVERFLELKPLWKKADNTDLVAPEYLKSAEEYLPHKK